MMEMEAAEAETPLKQPIEVQRPEIGELEETAATPEARAEAFQQWAMRKRPPAPPLSDEALRRESLYD
jgi:hypothetical protein